MVLFGTNYVNFNVDVLNPMFDIVRRVNTPKETRYGLEVLWGVSFFTFGDQHFDSNNSAILSKENDPSFQIV